MADFDSRDDTGEHEHAWSITARLAALPPIDSTCVGVELVGLIQESRELYPVIAARSLARAIAETN